MFEYCTDACVFWRDVLPWATTDFKERGTYFKGSFVQLAGCTQSSPQGVKTGCSIAFEKKQNLSEILNCTVYANAGAGKIRERMELLMLKTRRKGSLGMTP